MKKNLLFSALAVVFLWLAWIIAYAVVQNDYLLPSFRDAIAEMGRLFMEAAFWRAFGNTLLRTLWAFLLSFALGVGVALFANLHGAVRAFFAPVISVLRTVPTMAIILILLLWAGHETAPVIVSLLVLFPAFYAAVLTSLDEVNKSYGGLTRIFAVSLPRKIFKVYLPLAAPSVLGQAGAILSMGLKITISGEVLAQTFRSLGGMMKEAQDFVQMPKLMALTVVAVLLGFLLEGVCLLLAKLLVRWKS